MLGAMLVAIAAVSDQVLRYLHGDVGADSDFALAVLRIIGVNIVLSGDNAVVIALACRTLPPAQRLIGVVLGAGAAVLLRILFTLAVQQLLDLPWLKLAGGVVLLWVAVKLLLGDEADEDGIRSGANVWEALKIVAIADVVMSLDNVLAIVGAAAGDMHLIIIGLGISIPLVVFGATALMWLLAHLPILAWAGAALLGWIAGELIVTDPVAQPQVVALAALVGLSKVALMRGVEAAIAVLVVLIGWIIVTARRLRNAAKKPAE
jgi:YjbE family integral membrane protein